MTDSNSELTPEARTIISRARRSFMISMGLLLAGLIAVGAVIVYKSQPSGGAAGTDKSGEYALAKLQLPAGAEVVSVVAADSMVTVTYKAAGATTVEIFDGKTGALIRSLVVSSGP